MTASTTVASLARETAELVRKHQEDVTAARRFHDPDLSPAAMLRKRAEKEQSARNKAGATLAEIRTQLDTALEDGAKRAAKARPHIGNDPAELVRAEHVWRYDILPVLEAGETLKNFLRGASTEEALAAERFGRGFLAAAARKESNPLELEPHQLESSVANRLAATLPEEQRQDFEDGVRAQHVSERLRMAQDLAEQFVNGRDDLYQGAYGHSASVAAVLGDLEPEDAEHGV